MKVKPGLSTFADNPDAVKNGYMQPLLDFAARLVPAEQQRSAVLLLRATAGMRLVSAAAASRIYDNLFEAVRAHGAFSASRADFGTLSGEDEGVFGWLSVNQLMLQAHKISAAQLGTVGALDLGGGSTQITFATGPKAAAAAAVAAAPLPGRAVPVFTRSHLGFGNKQALAALSPGEASACLASGSNASWEPAKRWDLNAQGARLLQGRGLFAKCEQAVARVLAGLKAGAQPAVAGRPFVAMSLFFYAVHFAQVAGHLRVGSSYSVRELRDAAAALCAEDGAALEARMAGRDPLTPTEAIRWRCFDLTYAATLLGRGYGFREEAAAVEFLGEIEGNEVEWTRGALLAHLAGGGAARGAPPLAERLGALLVLALAVAALCLVYRRRCAPRAGGHPPYGRLDEFTRR
eukprot:Transcript_1435.p1 GENE.Transcript_1435~~Transcript_1435.p1  ORF type:complete len:405 (+),score=171.43 Transcript_1435:1486-2700(+)